MVAEIASATWSFVEACCVCECDERVREFVVCVVLAGGVLPLPFVSSWIAKIAAAIEDQHGDREHAPGGALAAPAFALTIAPASAAVAAWRRGVLELRRIGLDALEVIDEHPPVEAEHVGVGAQERLGEGVPRKQGPLLVLERTQVLGADLRARLELGNVEVLAHPRLAQLRADVSHFEAKGIRPPAPITVRPRAGAL